MVKLHYIIVVVVVVTKERTNNNNKKKYNKISCHEIYYNDILFWFLLSNFISILLMKNRIIIIMKEINSFNFKKLFINNI